MTRLYSSSCCFPPASSPLRQQGGSRLCFDNDRLEPSPALRTRRLLLIIAVDEATGRADGVPDSRRRRFRLRLVSVRARACSRVTPLPAPATPQPALLSAARPPTHTPTPSRTPRAVRHLLRLTTCLLSHRADRVLPASSRLLRRCWCLRPCLLFTNPPSQTILSRHRCPPEKQALPERTTAAIRSRSLRSQAREQRRPVSTHTPTEFPRACNDCPARRDFPHYTPSEAPDETRDPVALRTTTTLGLGYSQPRANTRRLER